MTKELLLKHIMGETDNAEEQKVNLWLSESDKNRKYYAELKNLLVRESMPQSTASAEELYEFHTKMEEKKHLKKEKISRHLIFAYASAAAAVIFAAFALWPKEESGKLQIEDLVRVALTDIPSEYVHTIYTENGVKAKTTLPDGSTVLLNSGSTISYPDKFIGDTREISFSGEGYFNVVSDSLKPMIIKTGHNLDVMVLGTEFNLKTFDSTKIETTLYQGKITLITGAKSKGKPSYTEVLPNTKSYISNHGTIKLQQMDKITNTATKAWTKGRIIFNETPLKQVVEELERWHGVRIIVTDNSILKYKITADFNSESIVQIADLIKLSAMIDYKYKNNILYLSGR
ncbi:MAG: DUF4974 domain-containing protein [Bacteroidales bacterium]|nr:DUF4974 domain-containing protein [Bacteroidales bacterium]